MGQKSAGVKSRTTPRVTADSPGHPARAARQPPYNEGRYIDPCEIRCTVPVNKKSLSLPMLPRAESHAWEGLRALDQLPSLAPPEPQLPQGAYGPGEQV